MLTSVLFVRAGWSIERNIASAKQEAVERQRRVAPSANIFFTAKG